MLGHAIMALLLGVHDEEHKELDNKNAPQRYLDMVSSEAYAYRPLYCPKCDSQRVVKRGKEFRRDRQLSQRWLCNKCNHNWFTPLKE